jgi:hypothetical protein
MPAHASAENKSKSQRTLIQLIMVYDAAQQRILLPQVDSMHRMRSLQQRIPIPRFTFSNQAHNPRKI